MMTVSAGTAPGRPDPRLAASFWKAGGTCNRKGEFLSWRYCTRQISSVARCQLFESGQDLQQDWGIFFKLAIKHQQAVPRLAASF